MQVLKQSTAATILVGPVLDADGAAYTSAVIGDFNITKNGSTAAMASAATATHDHNGMYLIALTTGNTDTLGRLDVSMNNTSYGMTNHRYEVLTANQFDALVTNGSVTPAAIADAVWDEATVDHTSTGSTGAALGLILAAVELLLVRIPSGVATMFLDLVQMITGSTTVNARFTTKALENAPGGANSGSGARTVTVTVNDGTNPLQNATVRMSEGANTYTATTNSSGIAIFNLDDLVFTVGITKAGYSFNGDSLTVDGNETVTYSMSILSPTPSSPPYVTGTYIALNDSHLPASGITFSFYAVKPSKLDGYGQKNNVRTVTSGSGGLTSFTNLLPGTTYKIRRGTGEWYSVEIPEDQTTTMDLQSLIGN